MCPQREPNMTACRPWFSLDAAPVRGGQASTKPSHTPLRALHARRTVPELEALLDEVLQARRTEQPKGWPTT